MNSLRTAFASALLIFVAILATSGEMTAQLGPLLQIDANPTDFDTTLCSTTKCRDIVLRNVGDAQLTILSIGNLTTPFTSNFTAPLQLQPGEARRFNACYSPTLAPAIDSQSVTLQANGRVPLSIALVFDTSGSMGLKDFMDQATNTTITRIAAANQAGQQFVSRLVDTLGIRDEASIMRYSSGPTPSFGFTQVIGFTSDRNALANAVPNDRGGGTCTFQALRQSIDLLRTRSAPGRRVIVLLSDGDDGGCGGLTLANLLAQATSPDVIRIFTIGIGNGISPTGQQSLNNLAQGTGGRFFRATTVQGLVAVYDSIATLLSQGVQTHRIAVRGKAVAPFMVINPSSVEFDSVRVGQSRCVPVTISNIGDAPLVLSQVTGMAAPFSMQNPVAAPILPGGQATIEMCFTPERLRVQTDTVRFAHNSCRQPDQLLALRGIGYDSVVVSLVDTFDAKPGSVITVPVYLKGRIPAAYDVDEYTLRVSYNKTMLFPVDQPIASEGTISSTLPLTTFLQTFDDGVATTTFTLRGGSLVNAGTDSVLVRLRFLLLHGNALTTPINLLEATFADGNPKTGLVQPGSLRADSICYQRDRLIDASERIGGRLQKVVVYPGQSTVTATYAVLSPAHVRLGLYDAAGRELQRTVDDWRDDGDYQTTFNISDLSSGIYFLRLDAAGLSDAQPLPITR